MDWYTLFKLIHIVVAIAWLGGGITMILLSRRAASSRDDAALVQNLRGTKFMGERVFGPGGAIVLLTGLAAAWIGWSFEQAWVVLGLAGTASTMVIGMAVLSPTAGRIVDRVDREGMTPVTKAMIGRFLAFASFDLVVLHAIAFAMVVKPQWSDTVPLAIIVVAIVAGAALFLRPSRLAAPAV